MKYPFRYDAQIEKYIGQFMRVFSGFQTQDGVMRDGSYNLKRVPVVYGNMSRVVANVLQKRSKFQANRVPMMAVNLSSIDIDTERKTSHHHIDALTNSTNTAATHRVNGPAFNLKMEVAVYASSSTELFSILEQILLIFNPRITIQVDNQILNSDYITEIVLESIQNEIQYPMGPQQQVVMQTLNFNVPIRLRYPYDPNGPYIQEIVANIFHESKDNVVSDIPVDQLIINGDDVSSTTTEE